MNDNLFVGAKLRLTFTDTTLLGAGVAKTDGGAVVFCPGAVRGDTADVTVTGIEKNYVTAALSALIAPSPDRIAPACPVSASCGGCAFSHLNYDAEKETKRRAVVSAFRRAGIAIDPPEILSGSPDRYRNKAVLHYDGGRFVYYSEATHAPVFPDDRDCRLLPPPFAEAIRAAEKAVDPALLPSYLYLRSASDGRYVLTLGFEKEAAGQKDAARALLGALAPACVGTFVGYGAAPEAGALTPVAGEDALTDTFLSLTMHLSPAAFYQVNHDAAEKLARRALEYAAPKSGETLADLYCGAGLFGMLMAQKEPQATVYGVEINRAAVRDARANAAANRLNNLTFFEGDSADFAARSGVSRLDCALIDPPRRGCSDAMIGNLISLSPARIVYVSCNPATLARDAKKLTDAGYSLAAVTAADLFPRTAHVETVVLMSRDKE